MFFHGLFRFMNEIQLVCENRLFFLPELMNNVELFKVKVIFLFNLFRIELRGWMRYKIPYPKMISFRIGF